MRELHDVIATSCSHCTGNVVRSDVFTCVAVVSCAVCSVYVEFNNFGLCANQWSKNSTLLHTCS